MVRIGGYAPGAFCWAELATSDAESATKFYSDMFGWQVNAIPFPGGIYNMMQMDNNDAAAIMGGMPDRPTAWAVYFSVASADESAAKVTELGGKIVAGPFDVMAHGRMAVAQDPQGAFFSLWQPAGHIGATYGGPSGQVVWPELATADPAEAITFYSGLFGWKTKPETGVASAQYVELINDATAFGGLLPMHGEKWKGVPPHWMIYITVADCDQSAAKATGLGAVTCVPPTPIPDVGRFSVITDPQGAVFSIIAR